MNVCMYTSVSLLTTLYPCTNLSLQQPKLAISTSVASAKSENTFPLKQLPNLSSLSSSHVLIIVTLFCLAFLILPSTSFNAFKTVQHVSFWKRKNRTISHLSLLLFTGYQSPKESSTNWTRFPTNVSTILLPTTSPTISTSTHHLAHSALSLTPSVYVSLVPSSALSALVLSQSPPLSPGTNFHYPSVNNLHFLPSKLL